MKTLNEIRDDLREYKRRVPNAMDDVIDRLCEAIDAVSEAIHAEETFDWTDHNKGEFERQREDAVNG